MANEPKDATDAIARSPEDHERELVLVKAKQEATVAAVHAVGEQVKVMVESPGVKALFEGLGQAMAKKWDYETHRLEKETEIKLQADRLEAQTVRRRDMMGTAVLIAGLVVAAAVVVAIPAAIKAGMIEKDQALAGITAIATLLAGLGIGRRSKGSK